MGEIFLDTHFVSRQNVSGARKGSQATGSSRVLPAVRVISVDHDGDAVLAAEAPRS